MNPEVELVVAEVTVAHIEQDRLAQCAESQRIGSLPRENIFRAGVGDLAGALAGRVRGESTGVKPPRTVKYQALPLWS